MSGHYHNVDHLTRDDIFSFIKEELHLNAKKRGDSVVFTLMLNDEQVGPSITIKPELKWERDSGHGGGSYISGVELDIV